MAGDHEYFRLGDQVYDFLQPYNVTVSGGRIVGVGVGGFLLGGGYSWLTNQVRASNGIFSGHLLTAQLATVWPGDGYGYILQRGTP